MRVLIPMLGLTAHGGNRVLVQVANEFARRGHDCEILAPRGSESFPFHVSERVKVTEVGPALPIKLLRWLILLASIPLRGDVDCIVANHFLTAWVARWLELLGLRRVIYLVQDIEYRFYPRRLQWIARPMCRWTYRSRHVVPANGYLEAELRRHGASPEAPLRLGIDPFFLQPRPMPRAAEFDVVCILRGETHKRADRLLAVAVALRAAGVSVLCIAQEAALIERYADRFTATARPASDAELMAAYDSARIFLLTSDHEGFALPPLECMARGLPAVMFPCGGPELYARDGINCLIANDESPATAAALIVALLSDDRRYAEMSREAVATARQYDGSAAIADFVSRTVALNDLAR